MPKQNARLDRLSAAVPAREGLDTAIRSILIRRFVLNWVPPSLNRALRTHWSDRGRKRDVAAGLILETAGKPDVPESRQVRVRIRMFRRNRMDADGAAGACKPLFDALVRLGFARDDSPRWMVQDVRPVEIDRKRPRTEIEIEALGEGGSRKLRG